MCRDDKKRKIHRYRHCKKLKEKYKKAKEEYFSEDTAERYLKKDRTAEDLEIIEDREQKYAFYDELIRKLILEGVVERIGNGKFEDIEIIYR